MSAPSFLARARGRATWTTRRLLAERALEAAERLNRRHLIAVDYPTSASNAPRYGHGRPPHVAIERTLQRHENVYRDTLKTIASFGDDLARIEQTAHNAFEPSWLNPMLPGLDAASIYAFLRAHAPRRYLEIGSGNSTLFAARAKRDGGLKTELVSIDPNPRAEIDALCDRIVRAPLEASDLAVFDDVGPDDVVFFDGSHRVFMNSDAAVFFLDVIPQLPAGLLVGVHDVYLPSDYPRDISDRYYSEQYLLACWLLAGDRAQPVLPAAYVAGRPDLSALLDGLWSRPPLIGVPTHGAAFWWRTAGAT